MATQVFDDDTALQQLREAAPVRQVAQLVHAGSGRRMALLEGVNRVGRSPAAHADANLVDLSLFADPAFNVVSRAHFDVTLRAQSIDGTAEPVLTLTRLPASRNSIFLLRQQFSEGAAVNAKEVELEVEPLQLAPLRPRQLFIIPGPNAPLAFYIELSKPGKAYLESGAARSTTSIVGTQGGDDHDASTQPHAGAVPVTAPVAATASTIAAHTAAAPVAVRTATAPAPAAVLQRAPSNSEPATAPSGNSHLPSIVAAATLMPYDDEDMDAPTPPTATQEIVRAAAGMEPTQIAVYEATQVPAVAVGDDDDEEEADKRPTSRAGIVRHLADPTKHASQGNEYSLPTWLPDATLPTQADTSHDRPAGDDDDEEADGEADDAVSEVLGGLEAGPSRSDDDDEEHAAPAAPAPAAHRPADTMDDDDAEDVPLAVLRARKAAAAAGPPLRSPENSITPSVQPTEAQVAEVNAAMADAVASVEQKRMLSSSTSVTRLQSPAPSASSFVPAQPTPSNRTPLTHTTQPAHAAAIMSSPLVVKALSTRVPADATQVPEDTNAASADAAEAPRADASAPVEHAAVVQTAAAAVVPSEHDDDDRPRKQPRLAVEAEAPPPVIDEATPAVEEPIAAPRGHAGRRRKLSAAAAPAVEPAESVPAHPIVDDDSHGTARAGVKRGRASRGRDEDDTAPVIPPAAPETRKRGRKSDPVAPAPAVEDVEPAAAPAGAGRRKRGRNAEADTDATEAAAPIAAVAKAAPRRARAAAATAAPEPEAEEPSAPETRAPARRGAPARGRTAAKRNIVVAFTGLVVDAKGPDSRSELQAAALAIGATVDDDADSEKVTHLVAPRVMTTPKFLRALSHTQFIVTPAWLRDSAAAGHALPEEEYLPEIDPEKNPELTGVDLSSILEARGSLPARPLDGVTMYLMPPVDASMQDIIETAGGKVVVTLGDAKKAAKGGSIIATLLTGDMKVTDPVVQDAAAAGFSVCLRKLVPLAVFHAGIRAEDVKSQSVAVVALATGKRGRKA